MTETGRNRYEPVYLISVAARLCDMHPQTLRLYERLGLVAPQRVNSKNRMYSEYDIERLQQIQRLTRDLGVNLAGVEVILDLLDRVERLQTEVDALRDSLEEQVVERVSEALRQASRLPVRAVRELRPPDR